MLRSIKPVSSVNWSIVPNHFSIAHSDIVCIVPLVNIARLPLKNTESVLQVVLKFSFVLVAIQCLVFLPFAFSLFNTGFVIAHVARSIFPFVKSFATRFALVVLALECISICKNVCALSVFERIHPRPFVTIAIDPAMHSLALNVALPPLAAVAISVYASPNTKPGFDARVPFTFINFSVAPSVKTLAMCFVWLVLTNILCTVCE